MSKFIFSCYLVCTTLLLLIGSILSISAITFDFSITDAPYDMVAISQLSEAELQYAFEDTVHYLYDQRELLDTTINAKPLFNQKEIKHMKEVKAIFQFFIHLFIVLLISFSIGTVYYVKKIKQRQFNNTHRKIIQYYFWSVFAFFLLLGGALALFFEPLFIFFHQIVFQNDDWLLSLSTDHLIQFLPEQFFFKRAIQIAVCFTLLHIINLLILNRFIQPTHNKKR